MVRATWIPLLLAVAGCGSKAAPPGSEAPDPTPPDTGTSPPAGCTGLTLGPGDSWVEMQFADQRRSVHLHVPPGYDGHTPVGLLFLFHGYFGHWTEMRDGTGIEARSDTDGFLVAYPEGMDDTWNAGTCCGYAASAQIDDVGFVDAMLDSIGGDYCVDPTRVWAAGYENGGDFALRLGCERSTRFAGVGSVHGTLAIPTCAPDRPVPVWFVHGAADDETFASYQRTITETEADWLAADGCAPTSTPTGFHAGAVSCLDYADCAGGSALRTCVAERSAGVWERDAELQPTALSIAATDDLLGFFAAHPMP